MVSTFRGLGKYSLGRSIRFVISRNRSFLGRPRTRSVSEDLKKVSEELQRRIDRTEREGVNKRYVESWKRMHVLVEAMRQLPPNIQMQLPLEAPEAVAALGLAHGISKKELGQQLSALRFLQRHASRLRVKVVKDINPGLVTAINHDTVYQVDNWLSQHTKSVSVSDLVRELHIPITSAYRAIAVLHRMGLVKRKHIRQPGSSHHFYQYTTAHPEKKEVEALETAIVPRAKKGSKKHLWDRRLTEAEKTKIDEWLGDNMNLVHHTVNRFFFKYEGFLKRIGYDRDDLIGDALFGVQRAFLTFDPTRGVKFSTFVFACMKHALDHVRIRFSTKKRGRDAISLSDTHEFKKSRAGTLLDRLVIEKETTSLSPGARDNLRKVFAGVPLSDAQRWVIVNRFGLEGGTPLTLRELGKIRGVSAERIRQIEAAAFLRLSRDPKILELFGENIEE